jgi:tetratricopeptide (TPR) repeat protein
MEIAPADLAPIRELYARGLYLQALEKAKAFGPFHDWTNTAARLLGGRLVIQLGAPRLGRWLHLRAFRDTPTYHEAIYYHARYRLERFGPLATWKFLRRHPEWNDAPPEVRADWYALHGFVSARLRDFDRSERWLNRAESISHDRAWLCIERASSYEFADRLEDALVSARRALELHPWFRPGVQAEAHVLQLMGRESEALERLTDASTHIESGIVVAHLAGVQMDLGHYHDARKNYERYAELSPLLEDEVRKWLEARRADTAYFTGDAEGARRHAAGADAEKETFYTEFKQRLEGPLPPAPVGARIDFPMPGPVTSLQNPPRPLELLARFWDISAKPAPDDAVVYDGLPDARERQWGEENGFTAIEFTVAAEAAFALLARGIPFLFTMVDAGYSHSQIAIGFDRLRHSVWLRDPQDRRTNEAPLKVLLERYAAAGPRGLALVPLAKAHLLEGIDLPEAPLYTLLHRLQAALANFDRPAAQARFEELREEAPGHRLARMARVALARYDANPTLVAQALDGLLELFPEEATFLLAKVNVLRDLGRREDRARMTQEQLARPEGDPLFAQHYAQLVLPDPRFHAEGVRVMRRAIRRRPYAAVAYYFLANLLWEQRHFNEAADMYRFAAALDERDEQFAEGYFRAARTVEQTPEAMRFLQTRYTRTKGKLAAPARALFYALSEQDEMQSAFNVVEQAARRAPDPAAGEHRGDDPGELLLFAAEMRTNYNEPAKGLDLLREAETRAPRGAWLRAAGRLASLRNDLPAARKDWEEVLREEPHAGDAHRALARLIADLEGREAAVTWLRALADRHPTFHPLQQLLVDWLRAEPTGEGGEITGEVPAEPVLRRLLEQCPEDALARREIALHLANGGRGEEALAELEIAKRLDPESPSYLFTLGHVCNKTDRVAEARAAYEEAVRRSVDNEVAVTELVNMAGEEEKEEVLQFVADQLKEQPVFGDGLLTFRDQAVNVMEPDDLLRILQHLLDEHPDLWQGWSTTVQQLLICGRAEEAHELAKEAVAHFPLLARLWVDLAEVRRAQGDADGQIEALRQAVVVAPGWSFAARELAEALEANQQSEDARVVLEQAVARAPSDPVNHGYLADNLWNSGESDEAFERLRSALKMDPGYDWAWRALGDWSERMETPEKALDTAREVARLRPGDHRAWLALVRMLHGREHNEEALRALDRAIALNPRAVEAYDLKAERLAEMGRYDEAKAAALPEVFEADPPMVLQGRAAWVEARRGRFDTACREMQALVTLEPHYYWGWQQLAEWYNETGKSESYLDAAEKLVDLRPDSPVALAMRGEAKLQTGDREGGKGDLREAQKVAPGYSFAGMLLFDAYLQDEEFALARGTLAVLQEHIGGSGRPFVAARYAQLAAHEKDKEAALDALRDACSLPCDSTWPINTAVAECRKAGWSEEADEVLSEVVLESDEFHPYTLFAWLDGPDGSEADVDRKLELIDRTIEAHPRYVQTYDIKAELLSRHGRPDEALDACHPAAFGGAPPLILRGRAAWVMASRGDRETAIAQMRDLLTVDPDYYWGWQQLANWYDAADAHTEYLEAAENLVRLAPSDPAAFGYRGEAKLFGGDRRGAKADFRKAFELDPNYAFAGLHLMDELLADDELDDASRTLARLQEHVGGPYVRLRAVRLAVKNKDAEVARTQFREMCRDKEAPHLLLSKAADALTEAGWGAEADAVLAEALEDEDSVAHVGRLWVERSAARGEAGFERQLDALLERGDIGHEALFAAIDVLGKPATAGRLHETVARYDKVLRETDRGWAKVAQALVDVRAFPVAAAWVADWDRRDVSEPWMLYPAALAFRMLDRLDEAYAVSRKALTLPDEDTSTPDHQVWVALEDALKGRAQEAAAVLTQIDPDDLDDLPRLFFVLADSLVAVQRAAPGQATAAFAEAKKKAEEALASYAPKEPNDDLSRTYRRWAARLAKDAGGFGAWAWGLWKKFRPPV